MRQLKTVWMTANPAADHIMLWAAACTGFFGFLRAGEFTVPSPSEYDSDVHLNLSDMAIDDHRLPSMIRLCIKQSKTDPFRQGIHVFLGKTEAAVCPVQAIIRYIGVRRSDPGPLFIRSSGVPLTRTFLVSELKVALRSLKVDESLYNTSVLGRPPRRPSRACKTPLFRPSAGGGVRRIRIYIKLPREQLAAVSRTLAKGY